MPAYSTQSGGFAEALPGESAPRPTETSLDGSQCDLRGHYDFVHVPPLSIRFLMLFDKKSSSSERVK